MSTHRTTTRTGALILVMLSTLAMNVGAAGASPTRELLTTFGGVEEPGGVAVDLETGNVYVTDKKTSTVDVFGADGGAPAAGVPSQITGVNLVGTPRSTPGVAVDNSCYEHEPRLTGKACEEYDPAYGDVYVGNSGPERGLQKFKLNSSGKYELAGQIGMEIFEEHQAPGAGILVASGVTVDSRGNVYAVSDEENSDSQAVPVFEFKKVVETVVNNGKEEFEEKLEEIKIPHHLGYRNGWSYIAVDDSGGLYLGIEVAEGSTKLGYVGVPKLVLGGAGEVLSENVFAPVLPGARRPVAVDRATGVVYVGDGSSIAEYSSSGTLLLTFGSGEPLGGSLGRELNGVIGIAVNSATDHVYIVNPLHEDVDVFGGVTGPPVFASSQPAVSSITRTSALIGGAANPESTKATYYFEYVDGEEYAPGSASPYQAGGRTALESLPGGHEVQTVERLPLTGLRPGMTYHYRMVVSNASQTVDGPDETFTTAPATPPQVSTGAASEITPTSVLLSGVVSPRGLPTSYVFEVGTDTTYGGARLFGNAGSSTGEVPVTVALAYLVPGTTYHYRLAATSFDGSTVGQDGTFTTPGVPSSIGQPPTTMLIASPNTQFPSIAGAISGPPSSRKATTNTKKLANALKACKRKPKKQRAACERRAKKQHKKTK
jgi:hypothetical protein